MSKVSKACDISPKVRRRVKDRDGHACILCGSPWNLEVAHYIGRAQLGLGICRNLVLLCNHCHSEYDNGDKRKEYGQMIKDYLKGWYPDWNEESLIYNKYSFLEVEDEISRSSKG